VFFTRGFDEQVAADATRRSSRRWTIRGRGNYFSVESVSAIERQLAARGGALIVRRTS